MNHFAKFLVAGSVNNRAGTWVFPSIYIRNKAASILAATEGHNYRVDFNDVNGYGLQSAYSQYPCYNR